MKNLWRPAVWYMAVVFAVSQVGCGSKQGDVEQAVRYAKRLFERVNTDPPAALIFQDHIETGGDALSYLTASLPPKSDLPPYYADEPGQLWCVVIRDDPETGTILIEGYGEDLETPLITEEVVLTPVAVE